MRELPGPIWMWAPVALPGTAWRNAKYGIRLRVRKSRSHMPSGASGAKALRARTAPVLFFAVLAAALLAFAALRRLAT